MRNRLATGLLAVCLAAGCGKQDESTPAEQPSPVTPAAFNVEGVPTVEFSVPDMMCEDSCVPQVRKILAGQPGVEDVKVDLATKTATVAVDKDTFNADAAVAALVDVQFKNTKLKTTGASGGDGEADGADSAAPIAPAASERS